MILCYLKRHYTDGKHLIVLVGCVKTTYAALVSLLFQVNCTRQFMQVFSIMFCKNKITVLIAIHWKVACEIIMYTIGETPLDKLYFFT